jgi:cytidine deaminase
MPELESNDRELIEQARSIITKRRKPGYHHIGAALRTKSGRVFAAVHLEANVGRIAVCAEAIAIGMAAAAGDTDIETIVAVDGQSKIISPCGMCRELIADYAADCRVIITESDILSIDELLPHRSTDRSN